MKNGIVFWITGLAGAGKTTIGRHLYKKLRKGCSNVIFLDGDILRGIFAKDAGHTIKERKKLALSYAHLCRMLSDQGIHVVIATISLFKEIHDYNRRNISRYYEIFIDCRMDELIKRDQKGIYSKAMAGKAKNVMGIHHSFDRPVKCHLVIDNSEKGGLKMKVASILSLVDINKM